MANWSDILNEWNRRPSEQQIKWLTSRMVRELSNVSAQLNGANVILYFSAFLQKQSDDSTMTWEDINGVMNAFYGIDTKKELVVIMHTPGGDLGSVESIAKYIHSMFKKVTVIVPVMSMSAGAMFSLSCDKIIISKAGQLGPTDPLIPVARRYFSVKEIIAQFNKAQSDILENVQAAHLWAPIMQAYGPALQQQALNVERYAKKMVGEWLKNKGRKTKDANKIIKFFHDSPNTHEQRIDYESIRTEGLIKPGLLDVRLLEKNQELQNAVMIAYHLATIFAENSSMVKWIVSDQKQEWVKNTAAAE